MTKKQLLIPAMLLSFCLCSCANKNDNNKKPTGIEIWHSLPEQKTQDFEDNVKSVGKTLDVNTECFFKGSDSDLLYALKLALSVRPVNLFELHTWELVNEEDADKLKYQPNYENWFANIKQYAKPLDANSSSYVKTHYDAERYSYVNSEDTIYGYPLMMYDTFGLNKDGEYDVPIKVHSFIFLVNLESSPLDSEHYFYDFSSEFTIKLTSYYL